jgi:hypothetical protein
MFLITLSLQTTAVLLYFVCFMAILITCFFLAATYAYLQNDLKIRYIQKVDSLVTPHFNSLITSINPAPLNTRRECPMNVARSRCPINFQTTNADRDFFADCARTCPDGFKNCPIIRTQSN